MEKLELKHLAEYLPYGLEVIDEEINEKFYVAGFNIPNNEFLIHDNIDGSIEEYSVNFLKLILRPLSDITNEDTIAIHGLSTVELELIDIDEWTNELIQEITTNQKFKLSQFEYLYSKHFDIHGGIGKWAIDINTLK